MELKQGKVGKDEIELYIFKISEEISNDPKLCSYYEALYGRLNAAMEEAEVITSGNLALDPPNIKVTALSAGLNLIHIVGKYIGSGFEAVAKIIKSNNIKEQAVKLKNLTSLNPDDRKSILKEAAEKITLSKKDVIKKIEDNIEVLHWREKGLIIKCKDFFIVNIDDKIHQNNAQILGCIDALKIIFAIVTE